MKKDQKQETIGHTRGEWKVRFLNSDPDSDFFVEAANPGKPYGIEIMMDDYGDHNGYPREQRLADAKLIAAAPKMLEALKEIFESRNEIISDMDFCQEGRGELVKWKFNLIEEAIKKATGSNA